MQKKIRLKIRLHFFISVSRPVTLGHDELVQLLLEAILPIKAMNPIPQKSLDCETFVTHFQSPNHLTRLPGAKTIK
jgi:hypothetical protein